MKFFPHEIPIVEILPREIKAILTVLPHLPRVDFGPIKNLFRSPRMKDYAKRLFLDNELIFELSGPLANPI